MRNQITSFFHCRKCVEDGPPEGKSRADIQKLECGWTAKGFQVWCKRHDTNIIHVDFDGQKVKMAETD